MIDKIIDIYADAIKALPWVEIYGGMTRPITVDQTDGKTILGKKTHPVACKIDVDACQSNRFFDFAPDSAKKSVVYWEIKSDITAERFRIQDYEFGGSTQFSASVRLVAWINLQKLGIEGCWSSSRPIMELLQILNSEYAKPENVIKFEFQTSTVITNQKKIFEGYTYEDRQGLMMYPFYAFAISGNLIWVEDHACLDGEWTAEPIECLDLSV